MAPLWVGAEATSATTRSRRGEVRFVWQNFLENELPTLRPGEEACLERGGACWDLCTDKA